MRLNGGKSELGKEFSQKSAQAWRSNNDATTKYAQQTNRNFRASEDVPLSGELRLDCQKLVYLVTIFCYFIHNWKLICSEKLLVLFSVEGVEKRYNSE